MPSDQTASPDFNDARARADRVMRVSPPRPRVLMAPVSTAEMADALGRAPLQARVAAGAEEGRDGLKGAMVGGQIVEHDQDAGKALAYQGTEFNTATRSAPSMEIGAMAGAPVQIEAQSEPEGPEVYPVSVFAGIVGDEAAEAAWKGVSARAVSAGMGPAEVCVAAREDAMVYMKAAAGATSLPQVAQLMELVAAEALAVVAVYRAWAQANEAKEEGVEWLKG